MTQQLRTCNLTSDSGFLSLWQFPPVIAGGAARYHQTGDIAVNPGDHVLLTWGEDDARTYVVLLQLPAHVHGYSELLERTQKTHTATADCPACSWILEPAYVVALWDISPAPQALPPGLRVHTGPVPRTITEAIASLPG